MNFPFLSLVSIFTKECARFTPKQISWSEDIKKASSGDHSVNLYDEEGYAAYRKAQRSGESVSTVKALTKLSVYHPGTYKGAWIKSELMATILITGAAYLAFSTRNKLIS